MTIGKKRKDWKLGACAAAITLAMAAAGAQAQDLKLIPGQRVLKSGERLDFEAGTLIVPEHHGKAGGPPITIPFERYKARHPSGASPIFFLAGGPGDSALDRLDKPTGQADVAFYSEFADVVFFDQRGGGRSLPHMTCPDTVTLPLDHPARAEERIAAMRKIATACQAYWTGRGIDLTAFTTPENGDDVVQLAKALGYDRISLVGGSYGSHLGLSLMRRHPEIIDRVVLRGIEGPDDTYDVPSGTLGALSRIAAAAEAAPELAGAMPAGGLIAALKTVEQRLDAKPVTVTVTTKGKSSSITLSGEDVRLIARHGARDKSPWPAFVLRMYRGDYSELAKEALDERTIGIEGPMHFMMDCASGISDERRRQILADPAAKVLGDINEGYFATCDLWHAPDLGAEFRSPVRSAIPILIFHGTWDTNTPLENAEVTARWFSNGAFAHVEGGTHPVLDELYRQWAPMRPTIRKFLEGGKPELPATIALPKTIFDKPEQ
ncbi:alpha/beta hydrolase [Sphingomonas sp. HITSZ_GF]|uniref:alpha/beta hydrolase n=1 Tax=Sphingomonas sp. HITSZ_GF TaxID=3037247 RepID=UPI00240E64A5|nr:alpha/beta hydrolase [Sphingomonas sp. HITSZ_GF]MDG2535887.1 alpha/beta hydrolase [Sphingomonas sp. HITSZ_GF]